MNKKGGQALFGINFTADLDDIEYKRMLGLDATAAQVAPKTNKS